MKLSLVVPVHNQFNLAFTAIRNAAERLSGEREVEFLILDNGSKEPFLFSLGFERPNFSLKLVRSDENIGVYPTFWWGLREATGDVLCFIHSDVIIDEQGWDKRVLEAFESQERLGMLGFIGSTEIDGSGGRGLGTASNFLGHTYTNQSDNGAQSWTGSPAEVHGRRIVGIEPAAVVDGCVMAFRRACLEEIPMREDFPLHHFYDRLLSCEVRERGWTMATLGVGFDHIGGQTVNQEDSYDSMARRWAEAHGLSKEGMGVHNWDSVLYKTAENMWLGEYRDTKHLIPVHV